MILEEAKKHLDSEFDGNYNDLIVVELSGNANQLYAVTLRSNY